MMSKSISVAVGDPGQHLRKRRERLKLRYRDVEEASVQIAHQRGNDEFIVGLSRLADIEHKGTLPSLYRLYSLCAIYRLDFHEVLKWYGIDLASLAADAAALPLDQTHLLGFEPAGRSAIELPAEFHADFDPRRTTFLSRQIQQWGKLPVALLSSLDLKRHKYGYIGMNDWTMYPILAPGSFVQIDETKRRIQDEGWPHESERPIYFLEHREGYRCGWCAVRNGTLVLQPHPASNAPVEIYRYPGEADIIGQVVAVAKRLDLAKRRHIRS